VNCVDLSNEEMILLKCHFQKSPIALIRSKVMAVMLRHHKMKVKDIAGSLFRQERTISRWIKDFSIRHMASIFSGLEDNENASKLTRKQKQQIKEVIGQPPDEQGIPKEFWGVPKLKEYVEAKFGVVYESNQSYYFILKFSGLSFKYPDKLSPNRNDELITQRITEIKEEIAPYLADPNWMVFAADEVRVQLESEIRRAWLIKGKRTIVKTQRSDEHQNYLGFLDQKNGECQVYEIEKGKQIYVIPVLEQLVLKYPDKHICVVWDNATFHKGPPFREKLKKGQTLEHLHLIAFPPYAPDHNPIEHVWQYGKSKIANRSNQLFKTIKQAFLDTVTKQTFDYRI
jgi:transposase